MLCQTILCRIGGKAKALWRLSQMSLREPATQLYPRPSSGVPGGRRISFYGSLTTNLPFTVLCQLKPALDSVCIIAHFESELRGLATNALIAGPVCPSNRQEKGPTG